MPLVAERGRLREVTEKSFTRGKGIRSKCRRWLNELPRPHWVENVKLVKFCTSTGMKGTTQMYILY